ncbi:unnamed protein product [Leptosia nina]|uniref:Uncharacterized protein n=1 Tax=Leptosia nina TaxID=320188 RepID=A0AAV1JQN1_9NEOP
MKKLLLIAISILFVINTLSAKPMSGPDNSDSNLLRNKRDFTFEESSSSHSSSSSSYHQKITSSGSVPHTFVFVGQGKNNENHIHVSK